MDTSEDESTNNGAWNVIMPFKNSTLRESGGNKLQGWIISREPNYINLFDNISFIHEDNEKSQVANNIDKTSLRNVRINTNIYCMSC